MDLADQDTKIAEQAYEWFVTLPHAGPQERVAFANWLKTSPRHVGEFLMVTAVHRHYGSLDPEHRIDIDDLLAEEETNIVTLPTASGGGEEVREPRSYRWKWAAGVSAAVVLAAVVGVHYRQAAEPVVSASWTTYETMTGESRSVQFEDGSRAHLNTQSQMQVRYLSKSREIQLLAGEVLFDVKSNPKRPFRVQAGPASIQALGTQFDVYRQPRNTKVSVLEGQVQVSTTEPGNQLAKLEKGEAADISMDGSITALADSEAERVTAWRQNQLIFYDEPLESVVAEFNRYNRTPKFRIADAAAAQELINGVFDVDAPESFVRVLIGLGRVSVEKKEDEVIIRKR